ncbi:MAG: GDP-mannose 4,6-dehydratase [Saprospiraceae bacterium]|nr:GDP-mannose 4,6-dehydratase [Saprospiraceae bacterium]
MPTNRFTPVAHHGAAGKVFLTGGAGFIGSHLTDLLLSRGHPVVIVDDLSTGRIENIEFALQSPFCQFIRQDAATVDWHDLLGPSDIILHLAASVGVKKVCESSLETAQNNHHSLECILEAMRNKGGRHFIYAGTSEVYGDSDAAGSGENDWLHVHSHLGGRSAYTVSKLYGELLAFAYAESFDMPVTVVRLFNTIGPRQRGEYGMVVPVFVQQALAGDPITVFGDGAQTRSFCDVRDVTEALYRLAFHPTNEAGLYNVGNPQEISMLELAEFIRQETGTSSPVQLMPYPPERSGKTDIRTRKPDISRIQTAIGWQPRFHWKEAVREIIQQYARSHAPCFHH